MKTPLRIAILECDTPPAAIVEKYGRYDRIFTTLLETAATELGLSPKQDLELSAFDVVTAQQYPDLDNIDAVLISGSSKHYLRKAIFQSVADVAQNTTPSTTTRGFSSLSTLPRGC
jgi:hypothetical protein